MMILDQLCWLSVLGFGIAFILVGATGILRDRKRLPNGWTPLSLDDGPPPERMALGTWHYEREIKHAEREYHQKIADIQKAAEQESRDLDAAFNKRRLELYPDEDSPKAGAYDPRPPLS